VGPVAARFRLHIGCPVRASIADVYHDPLLNGLLPINLPLHLPCCSPAIVQTTPLEPTPPSTGNLCRPARCPMTSRHLERCVARPTLPSFADAAQDLPCGSAPDKDLHGWNGAPGPASPSSAQPAGHTQVSLVRAYNAFLRLLVCVHQGPHSSPSTTAPGVLATGISADHAIRRPEHGEMTDGTETESDEESLPLVWTRPPHPYVRTILLCRMRTLLTSVTTLANRLSPGQHGPSALVRVATQRGRTSPSFRETQRPSARVVCHPSRQGARTLSWSPSIDE
jgi:hypothetical protein